MAKNGAYINGLDALTDAFDELASEFTASEAYAVGSPLEYGPYLEKGTSRMPPYPWLRPSVDEMIKNGEQIAADSNHPDAIIRRAALEIEGNARERLEDESTRPYPRTGTLAGSVEAVPLE